MGLQVTKTIDSRGRVALGQRFANKTVIIREVDATEMILTIARVIPEREAWLHENELAKGRVMTGLRQAEAGQFSGSPPDLEADAGLADALEE